MIITKDTEEASNKRFAIEDIRKRAAKAYDDNTELFNDPKHISMVNTVRDLVSTLFAHCDAIYETARPATKRFPAHTEVKFNHCTLFDTKKHNALMQNIVEQLEEFDLDLIYKPGTNSYSVKIS